MRYLSILLRAIGFWSAVFDVFILGWGTTSMNVIPAYLSLVVMFGPVLALLLASLISDRAIRESMTARVVVLAAIVVGVLTAVIGAADHLKFVQGPNMAGFWFQIALACILGLLSFRVKLSKAVVGNGPQ